MGAVALFLLTFFLAVCVNPARTASPDDLREQTVHVLSFRGESADGSGSGVVFKGSDGSNYVFTAAHCVPDTCDQRMVVEVHPLDSGVLIQLDTEIVMVDRARDLALLRVTSPHTFRIYARASTQRPRTGQWVQHIGFWGGHTMAHGYSMGQVAANDVPACPWVKVKCDGANLSAAPGCSGGPVFDDKGQFIGIMLGVSPGGMSYYVPLHEVHASLFAARFPVTF